MFCLLLFFQSSVVPESRTEEVQTMKAASAARSIWLQREVKKGQTSCFTNLISFKIGRYEPLAHVCALEFVEEAMRERRYRLILETELYDLPPPSTTDRVRYL